MRRMLFNSHTLMLYVPTIYLPLMNNMLPPYFNMLNPSMPLVCEMYINNCK